METVDFLVIGGGIVGLAAARELKRRHSDADVALLEKETSCGEHASGRNSGVLHAGFYYSADSLKSRLCREGNRRLRSFCAEKGLPVNACGKLVIPRSENDERALDELFRRAKAAGVEVAELDRKAALSIEPRARVETRALWSPTTASTNPALVVAALAEDAKTLGVSIRTATAYRGVRGRVVTTSAGRIEAGFVLNCAGLQADRVARDFGFSKRYAVLPFKGLYLYSDEPAGSFRTNLYPVPDPRYPFLGVHFTLTADGRAKIGPTAIPALWREHYEGLGRFSVSEMASIAALQARLFASSDWGFRELALSELRKQSRRWMVELASALAENVRPSDFTRWGKPGLRAQLVDLETGALVQDFLTEGNRFSLHVLNAVSPGYTCSLPFADLLCDEIGKLTLP